MTTAEFTASVSISLFLQRKLAEDLLAKSYKILVEFRTFFVTLRPKLQDMLLRRLFYREESVFLVLAVRALGQSGQVQDFSPG